MALRPGGDFPVYIARHGETRFNVEQRYQGCSDDSPLTERGRAQCAGVGHTLAGLISRNPLPDFVASPLPRARTSMEIVLATLGLPANQYRADPRLVEIDLGEWSGLRTAEVEADDHARWLAREADKWNVRPPGGENYAEVAKRAADWFSTLTRETVAITHGAFSRILRGLYCDESWQDMVAMDEPQGVVFRFWKGEITRFDLRPGELAHLTARSVKP
jgi:probable phosphoglycerate mutase